MITVSMLHSELQNTGQAAMQKCGFFCINEILKNRGRVEIIIENKILHVCRKHLEKSIKLATLSFYVFHSPIFFFSLYWCCFLVYDKFQC